MTSYQDGMMPDQFVTKIVGISFTPNYPTNVYLLAQDLALGNVLCNLIREPENQHDANSIRVDIDGATLGHIPRLISLILAPKIDAGERWNASLHSIVVSSQNVNQPGLKINVWRTEHANV